MTIKKLGYVRISSKDQNEGRQIEALTKIGIDRRDIYLDKQSGKTFERFEYQLLKRVLRKNDILYIHSLDRLGRNKQGILEEWDDITQNIGADIIVMDMPLLDTTKDKDSLGSLISDLVLQVLSWIAEEERERIRKRQREGIDLAIKNKVKFGRPKITMSPEFFKAYRLWKDGEITAVNAMKESGLKKSTFYRMVKAYEESNNKIKS